MAAIAAALTNLPPLARRWPGLPTADEFSRRGLLRQLSLRASPARGWNSDGRFDPDPNCLSPGPAGRRTSGWGLLPCFRCVRVWKSPRVSAVSPFAAGRPGDGGIGRFAGSRGLGGWPRDVTAGSGGSVSDRPCCSLLENVNGVRRRRPSEPLSAPRRCLQSTVPGSARWAAASTTPNPGENLDSPDARCLQTSMGVVYAIDPTNFRASVTTRDAFGTDRYPTPQHGWCCNETVLWEWKSAVQTFP